jgi:hypothetical protein
MLGICMVFVDKYWLHGVPPAAKAQELLEGRLQSVLRCYLRALQLDEECS